MTSYEVVGWQEDRVRMLDQRALPEEERYLILADAAQVAEAIRAMVVRGAPAIGVAAAYGLAAEAFRLAEAGGIESWSAALAIGAERLRASRPTAVNLVWAVERLLACLPGLDAREVPARLLAEAKAIRAEDLASCRAMGQWGLAELPKPSGSRPLTIMTHCNAGALATSGYGTALGLIRAAVEAGIPIRVIATETRPYLQGARLTAWELIRDGIDTTLITDGMSGHLMSRGEIDGVIVGADRVAANGDVANKIGTYNHAVLAARHGLPFLVAAPLSTIDLKTPDGNGIPIEDRPGEEITHFRGQRVAAVGVRVRNPAFDVTPAQLVTALVTEKGAVRAPDCAKIQALFQA